MQKLVLTRALNVRPKVKRLLEQTPGGRNPYDCLVFIDDNDDVRIIGYGVEFRFGGVVSPYAPACVFPLPSGEKAAKVYVTVYNIFILTTTGRVYATGNNTDGNCALPAGSGTTDVAVPTLTAISDCQKVIISTGRDATYTAMFLNYSGQLYAAGHNQFGQIGDGTTTVTGNTGPKLSLGPGNTFGNPTTTVVDAIGVGGYGADVYQTFCALLSNGTVWCVGYGAYGQMGNGTSGTGVNINNTWKQVQNQATSTPLTNIVRIFGCGRHNGSSLYALDSSNNLYAWGYNGQGQLAIGSTTLASRATLASTNVVDVWPFNAIYGSLIVKKTDNRFYGAGNNTTGQLGVNDAIDKSSLTAISSLDNKNIEQIFVGSGNQPCVFAKAAGSNRIYATGYNGQGNLGNYTNTVVTSFTEIPFNVTSPIIDIMPVTTEAIGAYTIILTADGNTYFTGQTRWTYVGEPTRDETIFRKNTKYIVGT